MVMDIVSRLKELDERALLSYWIRGEYEEAETYWKLAKKAEELGLDRVVVDTFRRLGDESKTHGDELFKIYREKYGDELAEVDLPGVEALHTMARFCNVDELDNVLQNAMESEKLAETIYRKLSEECSDENLRAIYLKLADIEKGHYAALKAVYESRKRRGMPG